MHNLPKLSPTQWKGATNMVGSKTQDTIPRLEMFWPFLGMNWPLPSPWSEVSFEEKINLLILWWVSPHWGGQPWQRREASPRIRHRWSLNNAIRTGLGRSNTIASTVMPKTILCNELHLKCPGKYFSISVLIQCHRHQFSLFCALLLNCPSFWAVRNTHVCTFAPNACTMHHCIVFVAFCCILCVALYFVHCIVLLIRETKAASCISPLLTHARQCTQGGTPGKCNAHPIMHNW